MRRIATFAAALAVPTLIAAGIGAPAALAADDCPNAAVRAQQQSQHLPNCMAYEKVTPGDKGGEPPGVLLITEDGNGVTTHLNGGFGDAQSFVDGKYRSLRSSDGNWTTDALMPAYDGPTLPSLNNGGISTTHAATSDLSRVVIDTGYPLNPNDQGFSSAASGARTVDLFLREPDGSFRWLVPDPSVVDTSTAETYFAAASPDLERIVIGTKRPWDSRTEGSGEEHLYIWTKSGTQLVTVLPNGDPATGLRSGDGQYQKVFGVQASRDARTIAFGSGASDAKRIYVRFNADDPQTAVTREVAIGPDGQPCDNAGSESLSADGRYLIFTCGGVILPGGPAQGTYIRDLNGGPGAVRLLSSVTFAVEAANADFSRVYGFDQNGGVVMIRDRSEVEQIATGVRGNEGEQPMGGIEVSADGEYMAFMAEADLGLPEVDYSTLTGPQIYRYAARTDELTCVSCRQDGNPTEGKATLKIDYFGSEYGGGGGGAAKGGMRPVSTRGTVTFSSVTGLAPEDTNRKPDAYAWVDERAVLLSSGQSTRMAISQGGSVDGSSLFFRTADALVADDRDGGGYDLYAVRINGGRLLPEPPPAPCTANCQSADDSPSPLPNAGTSSFVGRGNLVVETTKAGERASASLTVPRSVRGSSVKLRVKVSRAGSIRISGVGLRRATVKAKKAGTYRVTVRLSANGVKQQRSRGRLATRVTARFTPASGKAVSARKSVTFTAKKGGR